MKKWPIIFMLVGQTLDGVTTGIQLSRGCTEGNPVTKHFLKGPVSVAFWKGSVMIGASITLGEVSKSHPKAADAAAITLGAMGAGAGIWNLTRTCRR